MEITYLGHSCFRLQGKSATLVTDPYDPKVVGLRLAKLTCDIVTISHQHFDHNFLDSIKETKKVISGPGEYEISGVSITGVSSFHDNKKGALRGKNTIFMIEMDGIKSVHLGDLGHVLSDNTLELIGEVDILMVPVGGVYTIGPREASQVVRDIEPCIVIPMHYKVQGLNEETFGKLQGVEEFLKEVGLEVERMDKLSVKKEDLVEEKRAVILGKRG